LNPKRQTRSTFSGGEKPTFLKNLIPNFSTISHLGSIKATSSLKHHKPLATETSSPNLSPSASGKLPSLSNAVGNNNKVSNYQPHSRSNSSSSNPMAVSLQSVFSPPNAPDEVTTMTPAGAAVAAAVQNQQSNLTSIPFLTKQVSLISEIEDYLGPLLGRPQSPKSLPASPPVDPEINRDKLKSPLGFEVKVLQRGGSAKKISPAIDEDRDEKDDKEDKDDKDDGLQRPTKKKSLRRKTNPEEGESPGLTKRKSTKKVDRSIEKLNKTDPVFVSEKEEWLQVKKFLDKKVEKFMKRNENEEDKDVALTEKKGAEGTKLKRFKTFSGDPNVLTESNQDNKNEQANQTSGESTQHSKETPKKKKLKQKMAELTSVDHLELEKIVNLQRFVILGDKKSGKSSFIASYLFNEFEPNYVKGRGLNCISKAIDSKEHLGSIEIIEFWEVNEKEGDSIMFNPLIKSADILIYVFDCTNLSSLNRAGSLSEFSKSYNDKAKSYLIGMKHDLLLTEFEERKTEMTEKARKMEKLLGSQLIFCAASNFATIQDAFQIILEQTNS